MGFNNPVTPAMMSISFILVTAGTSENNETNVKRAGNEVEVDIIYRWIAIRDISSYILLIILG